VEPVMVPGVGIEQKVRPVGDFHGKTLAQKAVEGVVRFVKRNTPIAEIYG
jgi:hypothetical protein